MPKTAKTTQTQQTETQPTALERLEAGVSALLSSGKWKAVLEAQRRFHHYSFRNAMLIFAQCPAATRADRPDRCRFVQDSGGIPGVEVTGTTGQERGEGTVHPGPTNQA